MLPLRIDHQEIHSAYLQRKLHDYILFHHLPDEKAGNSCQPEDDTAPKGDGLRLIQDYDSREGQQAQVANLNPTWIDDRLQLRFTDHAHPRLPGQL
jgi:hypothetical protein